MGKKRNTILMLVVLIVFIALAFVAYQFLSKRYQPNDEKSSSISAMESDESDSEKIEAPDFIVEDMDGNQVKLSDMRGKPVVLNFWASWCGPCKSEMPHFDKLYQENKDTFAFMMVDLVDGQRETVEKGKAFIEKNNYNFPVYFDTIQNVGMSYGVTSIPTTLFIDKDGYVVTAYTGAISESKLAKILEQMK